MPDETKEKEVVVTPATDAGKTPEPSQSPIRKELDRVKAPKTEAEKAAFNLQMNAKRVKELGLDPKKVLGFEPTEVATTVEEDDSRPVTMGDLKKLQVEQSKKTALQLADEQVADNDEKELAKHYLNTRIIPSGNPAEDLKTALALVNSVKNSQIVDELSRKIPPKTASSGSGAPPRVTANEELTTEESSFLRAPWNMTKEQILATRQK